MIDYAKAKALILEKHKDLKFRTSFDCDGLYVFALEKPGSTGMMDNLFAISKKTGKEEPFAFQLHPSFGNSIKNPIERVK